jgi:hypothetical protein
MARWLAILTCIACSSASAEVYRCERDGKLEFSDRACVAGQVPIEVSELNTMETSHSEAALAARHDREQTARLKKLRAEFAVEEKAARHRRQDEERIRDAAMHRRVAVGMTESQVESILGEPAGERSSESASGKSATWTFRDGNIAHSVQFKDGKVSSVSRSSARTAKRRK